MTSRRKVLSTLPIGALAAAQASGQGRTPLANSLAAAVTLPIDTGGNLVGTIKVTGFQIVQDVLSAVVTFTGAQGTDTAVVPLQVSGSCQILNLVLGPLDLTLLGLNVHFRRSNVSSSSRDWLRNNGRDRDLYTRTKRELARKGWRYIQDCAGAKTTVIETIMARAFLFRDSQD